ncbi:MAG: HEAT repeat domain-containing protein, partial [Candidatus Jordarchaeales archaeon]
MSVPLFGKPDIRKMEERRDVSGLIKALRDKHPEVRGRAALALSLIKDVSAVKPLAELLRDENRDVRV